MGGIERTREGITVTSKALIAMLSVMITLLSGTAVGTYWATSALKGVESQVSGLRQALDYSVERTARALTIVRSQNKDINALERELAVVKNRLDNIDRLRTRYNGTSVEQ